MCFVLVISISCEQTAIYGLGVFASLAPPDMWAACVEDLVPLITRLCTKEGQGDKKFEGCRCNAVSALYKILTTHPNACGGNPEEVFAYLWSVMPVTGDKEECKFLYTNLLRMAQEFCIIISSLSSTHGCVHAGNNIPC